MSFRHRPGGWLAYLRSDSRRTSSIAYSCRAKYYREMLTSRSDNLKVRSDHLYQLSTYLAHVRENEPAQEVSGFLIYPANGQSLRLKYRLLGVPVMVATVDLSAEWKSIHAELIELIPQSQH
jgi:5-methylcytosine-specific restriction enzyme subunit McrC